MKKNLQFILYIINKLNKTNITSIVKLSYFCDISAISEDKKQISDYKYIRYFYGPFSQDIKEDVSELVREGYIKEDIHELLDGKNYHEYEQTDKQLDFNLLEERQISLMDRVIGELSQLSAKQLGLLSYKTGPMVVIGAQPGGDEHIGETLDLTAGI